MKLSLTTLIVFLIFVTAWATGLKTDQKVIASVGTHQILRSDFEKRYINYLVASGIDDNIQARRAVLNNMMNEILLKEYDDNKDVLNNKDYAKELEWTRKQAIISYLKDQEVYANIEVTDQELREAFARMNEQIAARHLYAPTLEEANNLYQLLQVGNSFNSLAKQTFTDTTLQNNGGYLGYFGWGDMDPAFEDVAYSMEVGEVSKPVKTEFGYSVIKLEDRKAKPLLTEYEYNQKRSAIERTLKIRKKRPDERAYVRNLFDRDKLEFSDTAIDEIFKNLLANKTGQINFEQDVIKDNKVCAIYDGIEYSRMEMEEKILNLPDYHLERIKLSGNVKDVIEGLLIQEKLYESSVSKGYDTLAVVKNAFNLLSTNLFMRYKLMTTVFNSTIDDSLSREFYERNIHLFSTENEINVQEIIVNEKNLADSLVSILNTGADFGRLAMEHSLRDWTAANRGIIGLAPLSKFGIFKELLWETPINTVVGPLLVEDFYGIFRVLEKHASRPLSYISVKDRAEKAAKTEHQVEIFRKYIEELRKNVETFVDEELLLNLSLNINLN